jgi:hypothetical protein
MSARLIINDVNGLNLMVRWFIEHYPQKCAAAKVRRRETDVMTIPNTRRRANPCMTHRGNSMMMRSGPLTFPMAATLRPFW